MREPPTPAHAAFLRAALALAARPAFRRLLVVSDRPLPDGIQGPRAPVRRKLLYAVTSARRRRALEALGVPGVVIPAFRLGRAERLKMALVVAVAEHLLAPGDLVLALAGATPLALPTELTLIHAGAAEGEGALLAERLGEAPEVIHAVLDLALAIGADGWEGHPIGTLLTVGHHEEVLERSRQLALNPFQGHPEGERHLLDPGVRQSLRAFATLDGAFVVRSDGVVEAAGRYLTFSGRPAVPLGLGSRHVAAAGISAEVPTTAVAVSQSTGIVRVYRAGTMRLELVPARRVAARAR